MNSKNAYSWICTAALLLASTPSSRCDVTGAAEPAAAALSYAKLATQVERNLEAGAHIITSAARRVPEHDTAALAEFRSLVRESRTAEQNVRRKLKTLQTASAADWPQARAALGASYDLFVESVGRAERRADRPSPTAEAPPGFF